MTQCNSIPVPQTRNFTWRLSVKSALEKPRWIIVAFQTDKSGDQQHNHQFSITVISQICLSCWTLADTTRLIMTTRTLLSKNFQGFMEMPRHSEQSFRMLKSVTRRPIDASIQRVYLLGFKELSFNILETRK